MVGASVLDSGIEGACLDIGILHLLPLLLYLVLLLVHLAPSYQVILVGHASFLNFLLGDHLLVNLLRLGVNLAFANGRLAIIAFI